MDDVKTQEEATGQSFSLGVGKRHNAKNRQSENEQGVTKTHSAEMLQSKNEQKRNVYRPAKAGAPSKIFNKGQHHNSK